MTSIVYLYRWHTPVTGPFAGAFAHYLLKVEGSFPTHLWSCGAQIAWERLWRVTEVQDSTPLCPKCLEAIRRDLGLKTDEEHRREEEEAAKRRRSRGRRPRP